MKSDAAVRGGPAEPVDFVAPMDRVPAMEEDRIRHGRVVIFLRKPRPLQPLGMIGAVGRAVSGSARRHDKLVARRAVDRNRHALTALVDRDEDVGGRAGGGQAQDHGGKARAHLHGTAWFR